MYNETAVLLLKPIDMTNYLSWFFLRAVPFRFVFRHARDLFEDDLFA
jgi:hypothetical protein